MIDSNKVRVQCRECRKAVMDFQWTDAVSKVKGSVKAWRAAFPEARLVNVSERDDIVDADFVHIRGDARARLHTVDISRCLRCLNVTDAAFVHLLGIQALAMNPNMPSLMQPCNCILYITRQKYFRRKLKGVQ